MAREYPHPVRLEEAISVCHLLGACNVRCRLLFCHLTLSILARFVQSWWDTRLAGGPLVRKEEEL